MRHTGFKLYESYNSSRIDLFYNERLKFKIYLYFLPFVLQVLLLCYLDDLFSQVCLQTLDNLFYYLYFRIC